MKVELDTIQTTSVFGDVKPSDGFLYSGHLYMKLESLVHVAKYVGNLSGNTLELGGYNAVRVDVGRPGSFQDSTPVRPVKVVVVREGK